MARKASPSASITLFTSPGFSNAKTSIVIKPQLLYPSSFEFIKPLPPSSQPTSDNTGATTHQQKIRKENNSTIEVNSKQKNPPFQTATLMEPEYEVDCQRGETILRTSRVRHQFEELAALCHSLGPTDDGDQSSTTAIVTNDEINARTRIVVELQLTLLPVLQQQLADLLASLSLETLSQDPDPRYNVTREILAQIGPHLRRIRHSVCAISPSYEAGVAGPAGIDGHYGMVKTYRCDSLAKDVEKITCYLLRDLFEVYAEFMGEGESSGDFPLFSGLKIPLYSLRAQTMQKTARINKLISNVIKRSRQSDLANLQEKWQTVVKRLTSSLKYVSRRIHCTLNRPIDEDSESEDTSDSDGDDESEGSIKLEDHSLYASSAHTPLHPHVLELVQASLPILKLGRIFYNRLLVRSSPTFTLDDRTSSRDIMNMKEDTIQIAINILAIVDNTINIHMERDDLQLRMQAVHSSMNKIMEELDSSIISLGFQLLPIPPRANLPSSENYFRTRFYDLRHQFRWALGRLDKSVHTFTVAQYQHQL
ncbi:hypothetical protein MJO28_000535 [Puccinia striiformis f. sp. tritici]|uniref:Uncharacterized protein n=3 Tax=Puccinia striiformis TaxID=27350 RepID=A0A0L0W5J7_9BASI|nr:hypothetical protein Pst134EA_000706 [Puccinia striiformis f. sp. tritici]KNF06804.1 hypothetical protein PSTG_00119 [Puccinia striiformis f. sp. tritici PST-78]POW05505.1 hypothetical protein PSHT_10790 [Puccinia striiformis]KAH9466852.1 hypothetical protein Pst134EB_001904 [Puccinia striiformis f. sp. tritici]KAH9473624.1 hypothetical protein Pst134EA_000706 [Puccinia striiformis f. sp. tritici]KAI7962441.1 hypothetical protein MJO28_000535 [Puccinia striiformis f. sp. tritici]